MASSRINELATAIAEHTKVISNYLSSKNLSAPSFDVGDLNELPITPADGDSYKARMKLIAATQELHDLVLGPKESLRHLAWDSVDSLSLRAMYHFEVAQAVPLTEGLVTLSSPTS